MINAYSVSICPWGEEEWGGRSMLPIPALDSAHVLPTRPRRFAAGPRVGKQTRTPIVYRLCSRPIAGTMEIIERANYDSEKLLERGIPASIRVCKPRRGGHWSEYSFSCLRKMARASEGEERVERRSDW